ncbi:MAG TPA: DUF4142 domain-containing protein [Bryobacteraceae bacterium]|nr:DUF4142 domain-containing protein [Bryobacteraceae bacterium]
MKSCSALFTTFLAISSLALAADKLSSADKTFARNAAAGGAAEVEMGNIAAEKGSNQKVRDFGQRMVTDHSKAGEELKAVATKKGITLPSGPSGKEKSAAAKMAKLSGAEFDQAYMKDMVADHEKTLPNSKERRTAAPIRI